MRSSVSDRGQEECRKMRWTVLLIAAGLAVTGVMLARPIGAFDRDLERLASLMTGTFSSREQAAADPGSYRDIRLVVVPIWRANADGPWLYVEQAAAGSLDKPYRQRVYQLVRKGKKAFESRVFEIENPLRFAGKWREGDPLIAFRPEDLVPREGCAVALERRGRDLFEGSTEGRSCRSDHRGASYATSEVRIAADGMTSWDRGYDAGGKQVWGAEKGPYVFKKVSPLPPE